MLMFTIIVVIMQIYLSFSISIWKMSSSHSSNDLLLLLSLQKRSSCQHNNNQYNNRNNNNNRVVNNKDYQQQHTQQQQQNQQQQILWWFLVVVPLLISSKTTTTKTPLSGTKKNPQSIKATKSNIKSLTRLGKESKKRQYQDEVEPAFGVEACKQIVKTATTTINKTKTSVKTTTTTSTKTTAVAENSLKLFYSSIQYTNSCCLQQNEPALVQQKQQRQNIYYLEKKQTFQTCNSSKSYASSYIYTFSHTSSSSFRSKQKQQEQQKINFIKVLQLLLKALVIGQRIEGYHHYYCSLISTTAKPLETLYIASTYSPTRRWCNIEFKSFCNKKQSSSAVLINKLPKNYPTKVRVPELELYRKKIINCINNYNQQQYTSSHFCPYNNHNHYHQHPNILRLTLQV